jgi:hypothetical protein
MLATTMATQNSQPSHAGNNHGYPKPTITINPEPKMHSKPTPKSITHASNHHNRKPQTTTPTQNTNPHIANHHNHRKPTQNTNPHIANHHNRKTEMGFSLRSGKSRIRATTSIGWSCGVVSLTAECGFEDGFGFSFGSGGFDLL